MNHSKFFRILVFALLSLNLVLWAVGRPLWQADESSHFQYIKILAVEGKMPVLPPNRDVAMEENVVNSEVMFDFWRTIFHIDEEMNFDKEVDFESLQFSRSGHVYSFQASHPPLYYLLAAVPFKLFWSLGISDVVTMGYLMRIFTGTLALLTLVVMYKVAAALVKSELLALLTIVALGFNSAFCLIATTVNNETLLALILSLLLWLFTVGRKVFSPRKLCICLGATLGLAAITKVTAIALTIPVAAFLLCEVFAWKRFDFLHPKNWCWLAAVPLLLVGPWLAWNRFHYGAWVPSNFDLLVVGLPAQNYSLVSYLTHQFPEHLAQVIRTLFAGPDWLRPLSFTGNFTKNLVLLRRFAYYGCPVAVAATVALAFKYIKNKEKEGLTTLISVFSPVLAVFALMFVTDFFFYKDFSFRFPTGRYFTVIYPSIYLSFLLLVVGFLKGRLDFLRKTFLLCLSSSSVVLNVYFFLSFIAQRYYV